LHAVAVGPRVHRVAVELGAVVHRDRLGQYRQNTAD
jgi:hypothetical protein